MRKLQKTFNLPLDVVEELEKEDNMSETVARALRKELEVDDV